MKKALITGATGMVGRQALNALLENDAIGEVISVGRRKTGVVHAKLREIEHADFLDLGPLRSQLNGIDLCIYCLGVYQKQVSAEQYVVITCKFQEAMSDLLQETSPGLTFCLFGAMGADPSGKSRIKFARVKGEAENLLMKTAFPKKYIFRPGYIHPTGERMPPGIMYKLMKPIGWLALTLFKGSGITDRDLGHSMVKVGLEGKLPNGVLENRAIRATLED